MSQRAEARSQFVPGAAPAADPLSTILEALGLTGYEARLAAALLRLGAGNAGQLAALAHLPRTSVYPVMDVLSGKGLAEPLPGKITEWVSPGAEEVLTRLYSIQEERLRELRPKLEQAREILASELTEDPSANLSYVRYIRGAAHVKRTYERLLSEAESELLMFTRAPYSWALGEPNPVVLAALARNITVRVLYEAAEAEDANAREFRREQVTYMAAGVQGRVVDELPIKLMVFDRRVTLMGIPPAVATDERYPIHQLIEHAGFARVQVAAFEQFWAASWPFPDLPEAPAPPVPADQG